MMAVQQRAVPEIEEVLISDSEDDDVIIVDDDETNQFEETKEFVHTINYERSSNKVLYNNGDFEHLPQLFANETEEIYLNEEYNISDVSNHSSNEAMSTTNVNSSDKENVPVQDPVRIESNDRSTDSDDERFHIAEDCSNTKYALDHLDNNEKIEVDVDDLSLSNNHKTIEVNANAISIVRGEHKGIDTDSSKHMDADADKLVIDESATNGKEAAIGKSKDGKLESKKLMIETSSDDDSEEAQDDQVIIIPIPNQGLRIRSKRFLRIHCKNCNVATSVPKLYTSDPCVCKFCYEPSLNFQCKTCLRCFETYSRALCHLKRVCAAKYFWRCSECAYAVTHQSKFEMHIQKAHANKALRCPHCRKIVCDQKSLDEHIKLSCLKAPKYACNSCDFEDRSLRKIKGHVTTLHSVLEGGFRTIVRRRIKRIKSLDNTAQAISVSEMANATNATAEAKATEKKPNIERLIKLHCIKCKKTFKKTADTGMKCKPDCNGSLVYQCGMCKEPSKSLCGIYDHIDNNCEFAICKLCKTRFKTKADAEKHKETCGRVVFRCKFCNYKTKQKTLFQKHVDKHNSQNITAQK